MTSRPIAIKFCSLCGAPVDYRVPDGDTLPRHVCGVCGAIHYQNPKIVAGCIVEWEDRILLCRRAIEPRYGLWTIPAGFMENGETVQAAACRETVEEARAQVEVDHLYAVYNLPHVNQVYMIFRSRLPEPRHAPGAESLETGLFLETEVPWDEIAFPVVLRTLRRYFRDRQRGLFEPFVDDVGRPVE